jgi:predicted peroxiredoxin
MHANSNPSILSKSENSPGKLFVILCASGFDNIPRVRSALMFATLASSAEYRTILYCVQEAVDVMVRGAIEEHDKPQPNVPSLQQRLDEAMEMGVEIQCCTQTMSNKNIRQEDLLAGVKPAGAMSLITLTSQAAGSLCF